MDDILTKVGPLSCRILSQSKGRPELVVVLCHGFGAAGDDLVPLGTELLRRPELSGVAVQLVFPEGVLRADPSGFFPGRAWWDLDLGRMATLHHSGEAGIQALCREEPAGLGRAREAMFSFLNALTSQSEIRYSQLVLGGFSQGGMLATDVSLRLEEATGGLCVLSGGLMCQGIWEARATLKRDLRAFQTHGRYDPVVAFVYGAALRDVLSAAGMAVEFLPFDGMHTIPREALKPLAQFLSEVASAPA